MREVTCSSHEMLFGIIFFPSDSTASCNAVEKKIDAGLDKRFAPFFFSLTSLVHSPF